MKDMDPRTIMVAIAAIVLIYLLWKFLFGQLAHLPGPSVYEVMTKMRMHNMHFCFEKWRQKYGTVVKVALPRCNLVVLNGHEVIHEALVTKGDCFTSRADTFTLRSLTEGHRGAWTGAADQKWKTIRRTSGRHLKQYGDDMKKLEGLLDQQAKQLVEFLKSHNGKPIDVHDHLYSATLQTIYSLIMGKAIEKNSPWEAKLIEHERLFLDSVLDPMGFVLDIVPLHYIFDSKLIKNIKEVQCLTDDIWLNNIKIHLPNLPKESMVRELYDNINEYYDESDVKHSILNLFLAGTSSTSNTLYALINILLHESDIYQHLEDEILRVIGTSQSLTLLDRSSMPYTTAVIYEHIRYHSISPYGFIRTTTKTTEISGHILPAGTNIAFNFWGVHHDEKFWGDPWKFRPERFLNEAGDELVPADHPNRQHLLAFSAGPRMCAGKAMALDRLFIWLVKMVQHLDLQPGPVDVPYDVRTYELTSLLRHPRYEARFVPRVQ